MNVIELIKLNLNKKMPGGVWDFEVGGKDIKQIINNGCNPNDDYHYMYIPYYPNNINCCVLKEYHPFGVSSRFSGCLMVAWEEEEQILVGHVHTEKGDSNDCKEVWRKKMKEVPRSFTFNPFKHITPSLAQQENAKFLNCYGIIEYVASTKELTAYSVWANSSNIITEMNPVCKVVFDREIVIDPF